MRAILLAPARRRACAARAIERLDDEVQAHLDLLADEYVARGMPRETRGSPRGRSFGGVDQMKERYRDRGAFR